MQTEESPVPKTADLELPIGPLVLKGPAVDAWNARKEDNNNEKFTAAKLRENYRAHKDEILADIDEVLLQNVK
jgi:hypothetical protein